MDELDHTLTDEIVCPYCGMIYPDCWELSDRMGEIGELECDACGKSFTAQRITTIGYTTQGVHEITPDQCPKCGSTRIVYLGYGTRWVCMVCNKSFTEEEYKTTLKSKDEDREATLKSTKGGFLVDRQMIKGA